MIRACLFIALSLGMALPVGADSRFDYLLHCGGCHLEDGSGDPPEVPNLRADIDWLAATPDGRSYLTRVPGASQTPLSDARLAGVLNWILETYYPGQAFSPFTAAEVASTRPIPLYDPLKAREGLRRSRSEE